MYIVFVNLSEFEDERVSWWTEKVGLNLNVSKLNGTIKILPILMSYQVIGYLKPGYFSIFWNSFEK